MRSSGVMKAQQNHQCTCTYDEKQWRDEGPAEPPVLPQLEADHVFNVCHESLGAVDPANQYGLTQTNQNQAPAADEISHHLQPVQASLHKTMLRWPKLCTLP